MTKEDLAHIEQVIKDTAVHVKNTTEKTNSDLVALIIHKQEPAIKQAIKEHVNGQFDIFKDEFREYVEKDTKDKEAILKWQKDFEPYVKGLASVSDGGRIVGKLVIFLGAVGAAILAIKGWFK